MNKKMAVLAVTLLAASLAHADPVALTKLYVLSNVRVGIMDHFHHEEKKKEIQISFAGLAFTRQIQMDPFFTFEGGLREAGVSFPIKVSQKFYILPAVFKNFDADQFGMAINATVLLR